jgi:Kef-type K+ transport system membrane component KefB
MVIAMGHLNGPVLEFLVLFAVILLGPIVVMRFGLPGLIGLVLGGFAIGAHGLGLIHAGNQTVPELGQLGLLYLMFVAGLEIDLHVLSDYRRAAVGLGLLAFAIPGLLGVGVGWALGWSTPAMLLLGALLASHTLLVYPNLRDAGLADDPAVATAVGATVLTDTLALTVLAIVSGSQTESSSTGIVLAELAVGYVVLIFVGLVVLPRVTDVALRRWGADPVARYLVAIVALLAMAMLAQVFGIEGIVGAFFAGLALNRLVPNEGPSMERVEFFGAAVFVPVFLVSIGLLLDPSVMFTGSALELAAYICLAALSGKAVACLIAGQWLGFSWPQRAAMFVLTAPQAAATLAVTLIGYEIGVFGTTVVNAVLVLILVSIIVSAFLTDRVVEWMPRERRARRLGSKVLVVSPATEPSDAAVRAAALLARPDGGHSELLITRRLESVELKTVARRIYRLGFEGHLRSETESVSHAVGKATTAADHSVVVVDDASYEPQPCDIPVIVVDETGTVRVLPGDDSGSEIERRLVRGGVAVSRPEPTPPPPTAPDPAAASS